MPSFFNKINLIFSFFFFFQSFAQQPDKNSKLKIPTSLGSGLNSTAGELSPVISADGKTLCFVRDSHEKNLAKQDLSIVVDFFCLSVNIENLEDIYQK